jgi:hypothetical protein
VEAISALISVSDVMQLVGVVSVTRPELRLVTSLYMIIDIQAGKTEFKFLWRSVCHNFPNILHADSAESTNPKQMWTCYCSL